MHALKAGALYLYIFVKLFFVHQVLINIKLSSVRELLPNYFKLKQKAIQLEYEDIIQFEITSLLCFRCEFKQRRLVFSAYFFYSLLMVTVFHTTKKFYERVSCARISSFYMLKP